MKDHGYAISTLVACLAVFLSSSCTGGRGDPAAEAPPPAQVEHEQDANAFKVDRPEQFPLATVGRYEAAPELNVTGTVTPDVSRNIPVVSIASGRVVEIGARLGDTVTKGQLLVRVQSADISQAFSDYQKAKTTEELNRLQLERSRLLYSKGAVAKKDLEVAEEAEESSKIDMTAALNRLRVLGADINLPTPIVDIRAPASGVITDQQVTNAGGVQGLASPNLFTISDLSHVWVVCDVYENDLHFVRLGEFADIHLNAYPELALKGRIGNIGAILDPNLRTTKVRLEVQNPGMLRLGMFVTATFYGPRKEARATVPAGGVLHLHDRDWVYVPVQGGGFRRIEVTAGKMLPGNLQEITSGIRPGQQVVADALVLQATVEQ
jgi:membrane fusion protein, heavy metal efflux system